MARSRPQQRAHDPCERGGRYLALYTQSQATYGADGFAKDVPLNHIGVVVDDLDEAEARVRAAGLTAFNHADYETGRRFYFLDHDRIEYELVRYSKSASKEDYRK